MHNLFNQFKKVSLGKYELRKINQEDRQSLFNIYGDIEIMRYNTSNMIKSIESVEDYINQLDYGFINKWFIRWAVVDKDANELIGCIALHHFNYEKNKVQIGYALKNTYWGKGIMQQIIQSLINYLSKETSIQEIEASIECENKASIRLVEKLGFKLREILDNKMIFSKKLVVKE